jgi:hypothetical protein
LALHSNKPPGSFAHGIVGDHVLIAFELLPADVALVVVLDQNIAFDDRATDPAPDALATILDAHLACGSTEGIGAGVDRVRRRPRTGFSAKMGDANGNRSKAIETSNIHCRAASPLW